MMRQYIRAKLRKLPDAPGVYFFMGRNKKILYIGRATSLRSRVRSYFKGDLLETRGPWVSRMLPKISAIDFRKTDSVLEAILLETDLIKKFQPPYNTREKDDKSFNCIAITDEPFPQVLLIRKKDLASEKLRIDNCKLKIALGPFPHGLQLKTAFKIIRRIFPWRDEKCAPGQGRPCFNRQVGLCPGVCTGEIGSAEYARHIRRLRLFLSGKKSRILKELAQEMKVSAKQQEFEKAGERKRMIFALKHIQDVALLRGTINRQPATDHKIEAYDLSHFGGKHIVGAMSVVENGVATPGEYRLFKMRRQTGADEVKGLRELLQRRFQHSEWQFPNLVVVDGNEVQKRVAEEETRKAGLTTLVVAVTKDERHRPDRIIGELEIVKNHRREILLANSEAHRFVLNFQRKQQSL